MKLLPTRVVHTAHHCTHCAYLGFAGLEGHGMYSLAAWALLATYLALIMMREEI